MKKLVFSLLMFSMAIAAGIVLAPETYAYEGTNVYDDAFLTVTTSGENTFISYSQNLSAGNYVLVLNWDHDGIRQSIEELAEYLELVIMTGSEELNLYYDVPEDLVAAINASADTTWAWEETNDTSFVITFSLPTEAYTPGMFSETNVFLYGVISDPADTVEPVFSYTSATVNTVYNNLITAATIKSGLTATDAHDGNLTSAIEIYDDTYTPANPKVVGGDYHIIFRVADAAGNYAYLNVDVNVIDNIKPYLVYNSTTYQNGATINLPSWYDDSGAAAKLTLEEIKALFTYGDGYYAPNTLVKSASCATANYYDVPGNHAITLTVTDGSGNVSTYTINVTVLQNADPVITGPDTLTIEASSFNFPAILAQYSATDAEDGSIAVTVDSGNTWNYATPALGNFTLKLRATDSLGVYVTKSIAVTVRDTTIPVFKINNIAVTNYPITVLMSNPTALQTLIDSIVVIDAWYGNITASKVVPTLPSLTTPGTTNVTITCTDASGNTGSLVLAITVTDDILPVISGPTKVVKGQGATLTLSQITSQLSATDNVSGTLPIVLVSDAYTGHATTVGSYLIRYKATDGAGNIRYWDVRVWVLDDIPPVWGFDDTFFEISAGTVMTRTELVALLQASGVLATDLSYTVTFLSDEYTGNEQIAGAYEVVMNIVYANGSESQITIQLTVPESENPDDVIVVDPEPEEEAKTGLQKAIDWVIDAAKDVWNWVKNAGSWIADKSVWVYDHILKPVWEFLFVKIDVTTTTIPPAVTTTTTSGSSSSSSTTTRTPTTTQSGSTTTQSGLINLDYELPNAEPDSGLQII